MSGTDISKRIPSQWSTLKKMQLIMLHNFFYVAVCKDKVLILPYYAFGTINNQIHRFTFVGDIDFNQAKLW